MDIVDGQVHMDACGIEQTLAAMDALGISSVLIDEYWGRRAPGEPTYFLPGFAFKNGAWRAISPTAERASYLYPERFSYLLRVDRRDPELDCVIRLMSSAPYARALRILPVWTLDEADAFRAGAYDEVCELAERFSLPLFLFVPGYVDLLPRYLSKFPRLQFIIDHCGMYQSGIPTGRSEKELKRVASATYFNEVLALAQFPNVALKWSHAQNKFGSSEFPFSDLFSILRQAIDAFGANRILWASDTTVIRDFTWSQLLHCLRDSPELSSGEKKWILGGTVRHLLNWPVSAQNADRLDRVLR